MKKIIMIRFSSLGDVIFNVPLANVLKKNGFEVTWLVSEKGIDIVKGNPAVDRAVLIPLQRWKKEGFSLKNLCEFLSILKSLRKEHFDIAIDTQMMFKSMIWLKLCGAKRRICYTWGREFSNYGGNERISPEPNPNYSLHAVFQHLRYARYLKLEGTDEIKFTLPPVSAETKAKVDDLIKDIDKSKPMVIIAPATTRKLKHWNKDNWKDNVASSNKYKLKVGDSICGKDLYINLEHLYQDGLNEILTSKKLATAKVVDKNNEELNYAPFLFNYVFEENSKSLNMIVENGSAKVDYFFNLTADSYIVKAYFKLDNKIENNSDVLEYHDITIAEINIDNFDRYFAFNNIWEK